MISYSLQHSYSIQQLARNLYIRQVFKIFAYVSYIRFESRWKIQSARKYISVQGWESSRTGKEKCFTVCIASLGTQYIYSYILIARKDISVTIQGWQRFLPAFILPFSFPFSSSSVPSVSPYSPLSPPPRSSIDIPSCVWFGTVSLLWFSVRLYFCWNNSNNAAKNVKGRSRIRFQITISNQGALICR